MTLALGSAGKKSKNAGKKEKKAVEEAKAGVTEQFQKEVR